MSKKTPTRRPRMNADAYAGFIRLLLTPLSQEPRPSRELDAYLKYLKQTDLFEAEPDAESGQAA